MDVNQIHCLHVDFSMQTEFNFDRCAGKFLSDITVPISF